MNEARQINNPITSLWGLNSLRFTLFSDTPLGIGGSVLFEKFFKLTPDAETHRKAEFLSEFTAEKASVA